MIEHKTQYGLRVPHTAFPNATKATTTETTNTTTNEVHVTNVRGIGTSHNISIGASPYNLCPSSHSHEHSQLLCKHPSWALDFVNIFHFLDRNFAQKVPIHNDAMVM